MPPGRKGNRGAAIGQVVNHRPLLSHPNWMVQWQNDAAGPQLHLVRDHRQCRARDRSIRKKPAKLMKMPFRRPNCREPVLIRKFRSVDQQAVLIATATSVAREIKQAEIHPFAGPSALRLRRAKRAFIGLDHYLESACEAPEQLQHRDIEGDACHCQPHARLGADPLVHASEEIGHVSMKHHHAFWFAGRT